MGNREPAGKFPRQNGVERAVWYLSLILREIAEAQERLNKDALPPPESDKAIQSRSTGNNHADSQHSN